MNRCSPSSRSRSNDNNNEETEKEEDTDCSSCAVSRRRTRAQGGEGISAGLINFAHFNLDVSSHLSPIGRTGVASTDVGTASGSAFLQRQGVAWGVVARMNRVRLGASCRSARRCRQLLVVVFTFLATLIPHRIAVDLVGILVL